MVCITSKGFSAGAADPRRDDGEPDEVDGAPDAIGEQGVVANLLLKIYDFCQAKHSSNNRWEC